MLTSISDNSHAIEVRKNLHGASTFHEQDREELRGALSHRIVDEDRTMLGPPRFHFVEWIDIYNEGKEDEQIVPRSYICWVVKTDPKYGCHDA